MSDLRETYINTQGRVKRNEDKEKNTQGGVPVSRGAEDRKSGKNPLGYTKIRIFSKVE